MRPAALSALALAAGCLNYPTKPGRDAGPPTCEPLSATDCLPDRTCQLPPACPWGEDCDHYEAGTFVCSPAGPQGDQEPCSIDLPCQRGLVCAVPPGLSTAQCLHVCQHDLDCPQESFLEMCALSVSGRQGSLLCQVMFPCSPLLTPSSCQPGEKCSLFELPGPFVCLPAGTLGDYESCALEADCKSGFACVRYGDAPQVCASFCGVDTDCPQAGGLELCLRPNQPDQPAVLCERATRCTPGSAQCPTGQACYLYRSLSPQMSYVEGLCRGVGSLPLGAACTRLNDCQEGLTCLDPFQGAGPTCLKVCSVSGSIGCPPDKGCYPITPNFGTCI